ncbi:hypothetical protein HWV62_42793 [Athelia sp. TMB]|nr:hypothetical protein HWV62_42793 [Athelia sp. TMB]
MHGLISSPSVTLEQAIELAPRGFRAGVIDWKSFIQKKIKLEKSWQGLEQPSPRTYTSSGDSVHRIKVDEKIGLIITTLKGGGVIVNDIDNNEELWSLPQAQQSYVGVYAHCEYDAGFLVFTRNTDGLEVWRHADGFNDTDMPKMSPPDEEQIRASELASEVYQSSTPRGQFRAWALIQPPAPTGASRFVYPTLLAASRPMGQAFLWNIHSGRLISTILDATGVAHGEPLITINYVELNNDYIVICGANQLRIFANRQQSSLLYHIPASNSQIQSRSTVKVTQLHGTQYTSRPNLARNPLTWKKNDVNTQVRGPAFPEYIFSQDFDGFVAAHFSPSGSNLVCMRRTGKILLVKNVSSVIGGHVALTDNSLNIDLPSYNDDEDDDEDEGEDEDDGLFAI